MLTKHLFRQAEIKQMIIYSTNERKMSTEILQVTPFIRGYHEYTNI